MPTSNTNFEIPPDNIIDKAVNYVSPAAGLKRKEAKWRMAYMNTLTPLKSSRRGQRSHGNKKERGEDIISATDRAFMHSLVRVLSKENPLLKGAIDRLADNVVPHGGILPNPTTDDSQFNKDAEDYYLYRCEPGRFEITNRFSADQYQKILLIRALSDGDFLSVFTNLRKTQGIEAERIATPDEYRSREGVDIFQGVRVNRYGAPDLFYVGSRDKYGRLKRGDHRGIQARNCIHSFITDRIEEYRGTSVFLPVLDHFRDIADIIAYEKFVMKMAACVGIKIKPAENSNDTQLPFALNKTQTANDGSTTQNVHEMFPGQIFNLARMGASDIEVVQSNRPGDNFDDMMTLLARIAGVGIGLPIELILLDFNRGNMASVRAALLEARKTFYSHYGIVKRFCQRHYQWTISQGVKDGILKPPSKIRENFWKCEWSEPVWNWLDPLKEIQAEGLAIAYGFKTYEDVAKQRGKDWAQIAKKLGEQQKEFQKNEATIIIGQPGATILGDDDDDNKSTKGK